jgi:hypothetical protein
VDNGIVSVHLAVAHGTFKALLDSELFLPESWDADRERCRAADIPDDLHYFSVPYRTLIAFLPNWPSNRLPSEFGKPSEGHYPAFLVNFKSYPANTSLQNSEQFGKIHCDS